MDNNELLLQLAAMMQEQTAQLQSDLAGFETRVNIKIENEISGKIGALFDGYKTVHEKQWFLERRMDTLDTRMKHIEITG